jgi:hypothetical protein
MGDLKEATQHKTLGDVTEHGTLRGCHYEHFKDKTEHGTLGGYH